MRTERIQPGLRMLGRKDLGIGCVIFLFVSVLTVAAQQGRKNPIVSLVQLPTPITVAYNFSPATDGASCIANLVQDGTGRLYGVASKGGSFGNGTVFSVGRDGGDFTVLHTFTSVVGTGHGSDPAFSNADGSEPTGLLLGMDGWLYGTTAQGGTNAGGTIFKLSTDGNTFSNLYNFSTNDGVNPLGGLVQGPDGTLYGTAENGGTNGSGMVFRISPEGLGFTALYHFTALSNGTNADGTQPCGGLVFGNAGTLYGAARYGGPSGSIRFISQSPVGSGTLFSIRTNGTGFTVLHAFTTFSGGIQPMNADGASPLSALTLGKDGRLYGTAPEAGSGGSGALFSLNTDGSGFTVLHAFGDLPPNTVEYGLYPYGGLTQGSDGMLYGAAYGGGGLDSGGTTHFEGTLYRINTDGSGLALLHCFAGLDSQSKTNSDGASPFATLLQANDGRFYGLTSTGGINASGNLFSFAPPVVLQMSASNGLFTLNWPTSAPNFVVESGTSAGGGGWTPVTNAISTNGDNFLMTLSPDGPGAFFRLHQR